MRPRRHVLPTPMVLFTRAQAPARTGKTTRRPNSLGAETPRTSALLPRSSAASGSTTAVRERAAVRLLSRQRHWSKCAAQDHGGVAFANAPLADSHRSPRVDSQRSPRVVHVSTAARAVTYGKTPSKRTRPTKAVSMLDGLAHSARSIWSATSPQPHEQRGPS